MPKPWKNHKVLLVDDAPIARRKLADTLREAGLVVEAEAEQGIEALELLEKGSFDIVMLDVIMPVMDGIECYRRLVEKYPEQKVLIVSALSAEPRMVAAYDGEIPSEVFLEKPLTEERLQRGLKYIYGIREELAAPEAETPEIPEPPTL